AAIVFTVSSRVVTAVPTVRRCWGGSREVRGLWWWHRARAPPGTECFTWLRVGGLVVRLRLATTVPRLVSNDCVVVTYALIGVSSETIGPAVSAAIAPPAAIDRSLVLVMMPMVSCWFSEAKSAT